jgi:hypothetical protein
MKHEKYPATLGLIEWIYEKRKNPSALGVNETLAATAELLYSFTVPFAELEKMPEKELQAKVAEFKGGLLPDTFKELQSHVKREIEKFFETRPTPKKKPLPITPKKRR